MPARTLLAIPSILLFAALLPAQYNSIPPILVRPLVHNQGLTPPGAVMTSDITIQNLGGGNHLVGLTYQTSFAGQPMARAFTYNANTNTSTPRPDLNSLPPGIDTLAISSDLLTVAAYQLGVGQRVFQRPNLAASFGPGAPIQNLPSTASGLEFCRINGTEKLVALFNEPQHSSIEIYDYDPVTNSVSNPIPLSPPLGHPANFPAFVIPINDVFGNTRGFAVCIRQPLGFQQRVLFTPGVDGTAPWLDWFDPPAGVYLNGGAQFGGGHLIGINNSPFGPLQGGATDIVGMFTFDAIGSTQGGSVTLTMMGPPGSIGVFAIATNLAPSVILQGFQNRFGLNLGTILATFFVQMPEGVGQFNLAHGPTAPFAVRTQSVSWDIAYAGYNAAAFANTADFSFQ